MLFKLLKPKQPAKGIIHKALDWTKVKPEKYERIEIELKDDIEEGIIKRLKNGQATKLELMVLLKVNNERYFRYIIESLRERGAPILSDTKGYYLASTVQERNEWCQNYVIEAEKTRNTRKRVYAGMMNQKLL